MSDTLLITGTVLAYAAGAGGLYWFIRRRRIERERKEKEFVDKLVLAIGNDAIKSINDIKDLYYGFFHGGESPLSEIHRIGLLLSKVKLILSSENITEPNKRTEFLSIVNHLLSEEQALAKAEKAKAPFSGVPSPERPLLEDLREISGAKENQFIQDKLGELASAIKIRQETVEKLSEEKGQSLKWAKWGLFGTVTFSLLSILITYYFSTST